MWELNKPVPVAQTTMDSDAGIFLRREIANAAGDDGEIADIMCHCYQIPFTMNTDRHFSEIQIILTENFVITHYTALNLI
ncbi:MAG: hypothetical protein EOP84_15530 [Verrucomicrobiaceae bacterium]|nr:MAG: hypothetical protein EOP84_15530 [Verrucomicrobiaceae bacterium]